MTDPSTPWFAFRARREERRAREDEEYRLDVERRVDRARLIFAEGGVESLYDMVAPSSLSDVSIQDAVRSILLEVIRLRARVEELERQKA